MTTPLHSLTMVETFALGCDHLGVRLRAAPEFAFVAGQWGNLLIPTADGKERRALSFASPPAHLPEVELCVRRKADSLVVEALEHAAPGTAFELEGPFGAFQWRGPAAGPTLFVATSTGIAPIRSMLLEAAAEAPPPHEAVLLHAVAHDRERPYGEEASAWPEAWPDLTLEFRVEDAEGDEADPATWQTTRERSVAIVEGWRERRDSIQVYLAGHGALVKPLRQHLREVVGLERAQIRAEIFWP